MRRLASLLLLALVAATRLCAQAELTKIENLRLVEGRYGDGDSFHVTDGATNYHFRLYLVDTPETEAADPSLARRVREQTRYFGLPGPADTLRLGKIAAERAFSDAAASSGRWDAVAACPGDNVGPILSAHHADGGPWQRLVKEMLEGHCERFQATGPYRPWMPVDVRDTAACHVGLLESDAVANGQRFLLLSTETRDYADICASIDRVLPELQHDPGPVVDNSPERWKARASRRAPCRAAACRYWTPWRRAVYRFARCMCWASTKKAFLALSMKMHFSAMPCATCSSRISGTRLKPSWRGMRKNACCSRSFADRPASISWCRISGRTARDGR